MVQFDSAINLSANRKGLLDLYHQSQEAYAAAREKGKIRDDADALFDSARPLRFRLIGFCGDLAEATRELKKVLAPFYVLENDNWTTRPELGLLDEPRKERLLREVNELLFLWIVALDSVREKAAAEDAARITDTARKACARALVFARPSGPWEALRDRLADGPDRRGRPERRAADIEADFRQGDEKSPLACFQWGLLRAREGRRGAAVAWFRQAVQLEPSSYWYHHYLAWTLDQHPRDPAAADDMLEHYDTAVALEPDAPWVRFCRARLYHSRSAWDLALKDLQRALKDFDALPDSARDGDFLRRVRLEFGVIHRALGDVSAGRSDYAAVIASNPIDHWGRAARLDRARIDVESGALESARAEYDALIAEDPDDGAAWQARALLNLQCGRAADAETDLTAAIQMKTPSGYLPDLLASRALTRLILGRPLEAFADAEQALHARPSPEHQRLWTRAALALSQSAIESEALSAPIWLDDPETIARLPLQGRALTESLQGVARRLARKVDQPTGSPHQEDNHGTTILQGVLTRAVILAALDDPQAETEATRGVALAPLSPRVYLIRARVRRYLGQTPPRAGRRRAWSGPRTQRTPALGAARSAPHRGRRPARRLADLDEALRLGAGGPAYAARGTALYALGQDRQAAHDWTIALSNDPANPRGYIDRARAFLRLGKRDHARADLEQAVAWTEDWGTLGLPIFVTYARCVLADAAEESRRKPNPPFIDQLDHLLALACRAWAASHSF